MDFSSNYHRAAALLFVSAVLHLVVLVLSGGSYLMEMLIGLVVWTLIGFGLMRHWRWLAYIAFLLGMMGAIFAFGVGMSEFGLVRLSLFGIAIADVLAVLVLFALLWRNRPTSDAI